jgi:hypothetical protein
MFLPYLEPSKRHASVNSYNMLTHIWTIIPAWQYQYVDRKQNKKYPNGNTEKQKYQRGDLVIN